METLRTAVLRGFDEKMSLMMHQGYGSPVGEWEVEPEPWSESERLVEAQRPRVFTVNTLNSLREDFYTTATASEGAQASTSDESDGAAPRAGHSCQEDGKCAPLTVLQACTFIEDAFHYRSINHRVDEKSLLLYQYYYSRPAQWFLNITIFVLLLLAFFEYPSSFVKTSDIRQHLERIQPPCGVVESVEILCLLILLADVIIKSYLGGKVIFLKSRWLWGYWFVITFSLLDWCITLSLGCSEVVRIRRMLRPFFLLQHSSLMKKTVNSLRRSLPQVLSVLLLLFMHIYLFTLFGMLLYPHNAIDVKNTTKPDVPEPASEFMYFDNLPDSFMNLLILLTTANNPDVTMPAYNINRFYAIYFVLFLFIGLYCFMNMLTAVIYNQFRGYFLNSMQASLFRRRLAICAAFGVLQRRIPGSSYTRHKSSGVDVCQIITVVKSVNIPEVLKDRILVELRGHDGSDLSLTQFQDIFTVLEMDLTTSFRPSLPSVQHPCTLILQTIVAHRYFMFFGCFVAFINVICISVELVLEFDHVRNSVNSVLGILNMAFVLYYVLEQSLRIWALGWARYYYDKGNVFDGIITFVLGLIQLTYVCMYGIPFWGNEKIHKYPVTLWDFVRVINMLIMIRLFRVVAHIRAMLVVVSTLIDLIKNLKAFAGIMVVIYYSYALLGMELFQGVVLYDDNVTHNYSCGSYEQLDYWANNFDDFGASLIVLWDVMVVNNWHVFLSIYSRKMNKYTQIYFVVWWLMSVVICLNLFTALILENFIMRWDRAQHQRRRPHADSTGSDSSFLVQPEFRTVHDMFRNDLEEPSEESLLSELRNHPHLIVTC